MNPDALPVVRFRRLQPIPPAHPRPWFPTLPVIGRAGRAEAVDPVDSRFLAPDALLLPSGKVATYWALRDAGVAPGDRVAVPAYHCPTMIHPIVALRAQPLFVPVTSGLEITPDEVERAIAAGVRALVLPHYFGFVQPAVEAIARRCRQAGVALIEDCAHAMYARRGAPLPGSWGDYAIASTRKFVAAAEGGALAANGRPLTHPTREPAWRDELRGLRLLLAEAREYGSLAPGHAAAPRADAEPIGPPDEESAQAEARPAPAAPAEVDAAASPRLALRSVRLQVARADHARIAAVRRARYARWSEALRGVPDAQPFVRDIGSDHVPYVFPVRLPRPEAQFRALKYHGIAVWRWDQLAESDCPVSPGLALSLVQMPCQHSLGDAAFERLVREFVAALRGA